MKLHKRLGVMLAPAMLLVSAVAFGGPDDASSGFFKKINLTPQETVTQAQDYQTKMLDAKKRIEGLQDRARKDKDVIKLNCVNDKLVQVNGHLAVSSQTMKSLDNAIARGDDGARQHEFTRFTIVYQKVLVLATEAEACIGEDVSYVGATKVDVEVDPGVPQDDPTLPQLPLPDVTRPPEASPFA